MPMVLRLAIQSKLVLTWVDGIAVAAYGRKAEQNSIKLAVDEINKASTAKAKLVTKDNKSENAKLQHLQQT